MKTVRFSNVVAKGGKPEPYTLWTDPKKDGEFQRALKQNRVLSVHQETVGHKADYGTVGFKGDRKAQLLVFPKSLRSFEGRKVVGVKYGLVDQPTSAHRQKTAPAKPHPKRTAKKSKPATKREPAKIVPFPKAKMKSQATPPSRQPTKSLKPLLHRAIKALEAGKAVKAHKLLQQLDKQMP